MISCVVRVPQWDQQNGLAMDGLPISYDQLLRQVEVLKVENSNLRQELQDNSNHLTKLESEASNMKVGGNCRRTVFRYS